MADFKFEILRDPATNPEISAQYNPKNSTKTQVVHQFILLFKGQIGTTLFVVAQIMHRFGITSFYSCF
jgi:hypothetical protein